MRKLISFKQAGQLSLFLFGVITLFHIAVLIGIFIFDYVPAEFLWGGRMETREQLIGFEIISVFISLLCVFAILIRTEWIRIPRLIKIIRVVLWLLFILFVLNTIGNILAKTTFEKIFALLTAIISFLVLRLAIEKDS
jgi:hypothetical protein